MSKVRFKKDLGPIVFVGGMNAMPMMYAIELKKLGYEVIYIVDRPKEDKLSRPENHFSDISYPYPKWIVEFLVVTQMVLPFARWFFAKKIERIVAERSSKPVQAYILNGFFISLIPFLQEESKKIALSHGSDLDSWADLDGLSGLADAFKNKSFFKLLPDFLAKRLIAKAVKHQFSAFENSDVSIYFPKGFNSFGDRVVEKIKLAGVDVIERYDISFEPLKNEIRSFKNGSGKLVIFSGVRFTFETFSEGNAGYAKGNDHIINGLGLFYKDFKNIEIHFVEKGPDVKIAKRLCAENGLSSVVVWHKEMKFTELLGLYRIADICFDQVGSHWIGAIGGYALWLGKPLIANDYFPIKCGIWPENNPICSASNADEVYEQLVFLQNLENRRYISEQSKVFAESYFSPRKVVSELVGQP